MAESTYFTDLTTVIAREAEVAAADFDNGMNQGGSCAPGIGINIGGGAVVGTPEQFTLLDQDGDARVPQVTQHIGGNGLNAGVAGKGTEPIEIGVNDLAGDGGVAVEGNAVLVDLAGGWAAVI